jgi:iron complex outermembrane receptor protein
MSTIDKRTLSTTLFACTAAMALATAAQAQTAATPQAAAAQPAADSTLEEVVVTARRREERLQDVPIAVAAFTPERLQQAQVTTARQLVGMVPSLNVNSGNQRDFQRFSIRGQGATVGAGESVTVYFAEAPLSQFIAGGPGLYFDLENLQVLTGPQGTLFGRNTIGGAVLFTPKQPTDRNEGFVQAGGGNYKNTEFAGVANYAAIPGVLRFRASVDLRRREGFTTQVADNSKLDAINYQTYRFGALYTPNDQISNYLVAQYTISDTSGTGISLLAVNPASAFGPALAPYLPQQQALGIRKTLSTGPHWWFTRSALAVNTTTVKLTPNLTIKNVASFSRIRVSGGFDNDGTPVNATHFLRTHYAGQPSAFGENRNEYLTEEAQLQGNALDNKLNWVTGGFWQNTYPYGYQEINTVGGGVLSPTISHVNSTTKALFAQATLDLGVFSESLDKLKFTGGYRYTWDTRHYSAFAYNSVTQVCTTDATKRVPNCAARFDGKFKAPTYNLTLDYKITPQILAYVTNRTGYKSGGFNTVINSQVPTSFAPEKVKDWELGLKADWRLGGVPIRTNVDIFQDKYKDIQRSVFLPNPQQPGAILTYLANAAQATIKGFEGQVTARPADGLTVDLTYSYLDAKYDSYPNFRDLSLPGTPLQQLVNLGGHRLPFAPKTKYGVNVRYELPVGQDLGRFDVYGGLSYQSHFLTTDQPQPAVYRIGNYTLVNLGANWRDVGGQPIDIETFVTNVTNKKAIAAGQVFYYSIGAAAASFIEPRMYGVRVRYRFGGA